MLSKIDESVEVCDNFYDFSCGNFKPLIPEHKTKMDSFSSVLDTLQDKLNISMSAKVTETDIEPFKKLKVFFQNCMEIG